MIPTYYPWQTQQKNLLFNRFKTNNLPHALLLTGVQGLGKLSFAQAFAARLLCQATATELESSTLACGSCQSCQWLIAGTHPDLLLIQPTEKTVIIKIEQIRDLLTQLHQTAHNLQQVVILTPVEAMNIAATNALLKTLEEPTGKVTFLLITHQFNQVFPTIKSRCQLIKFSIPPLTDSLEWLKKQLPLAKNHSLLLSLANHIPFQALALAQDTSLNLRETLILHFLQLSENQTTPSDMASVCITIQTEIVINSLYLLLIDLVYLHQAISKPIIHLQHLKILSNLSTKITLWQIFYFVDKLIDIKKQISTKIHFNLSLLWESLFSEWKMMLS